MLKSRESMRGYIEMRLATILLSSVAVLSTAPAFAQTQPAQPPATPAPAAQDDMQDAGDIVVTATRRSERLADVPIAVSAVSEQALQNSGATDIRSMTQLVPSLQVSSTGSEANASARVRGIGTVGDNPGLESSVAVFIDGVYRSRTGSGLNDLGEVERIEVLRGPQGTLSGRNSSAGAINIYTKKPSFDFGGYAEGSYGNYDAVRLAGALTGPVVKDLLAFRIDGVYNNRKGFYDDVVNKTDYNNRNRYFLRGQLLLEPSSDFSFRLIGDYTRRNEKCCGAVYIDTREKIDPTPGVPGDYAINPAGNRIVAIMQSMGGIFPSAGDPYNRQIANTPGRAYSNLTYDWGVSGQADWNLGGASLTSITAYRYYKSYGAADIDYGNLDIGYRANDGNSYREFKTFSQELRLNGEAFGGKLNWLIGGYYSHEDLQLADNLKFGTQYGPFAACRVVSNVSAVAALRDPTAPGCLSPLGRATITGAFGPAAPVILGGLDRLSTLKDLGSIRDLYNVRSENFAFFTHNIFKITDRLSLTAGLRWTHESKDFNATFNNNNTVCASQMSALAPYLSNAALSSTIAGILTLSCTGNSNSMLSGKTIADKLRESQFTGTAVLSYKPTDHLMIYASYARGYKAGGYNLDRSDLGAAYLPATTLNPNAGLLRFDPETVDAYEAGFKLSTRKFTLNVAAFRSDFQNFQLNTFNGTNYVVQNIGSCSDNLNGGDRDASATTGACTGKVGTGVRSQGVEIEAGIYPVRDLAFGIGYTLADTKYRNNLVGSQSGEALDPALFLLAGSQMSNAPRNVITTSVSWTPPIGSSGMSALFYVDQRTTSDYNTGSDLFYEKAQDGFTLVNARVGLRGANDRWAIEFWAQNLTNTKYMQVAFNAPFQGAGAIGQVMNFGAPGSAVGNQIFSAFLAEPRTYGLTLRTRF